MAEAQMRLCTMFESGITDLEWMFWVPRVIIWVSFVTVPVILTLHRDLHCEIEGTKEKHTLLCCVRVRTRLRYRGYRKYR
jgi:hypothetical protein